jgi:hypothetical protein
MTRTINSPDWIEKQLEAGRTVELDDLGLEWIEKAPLPCRGCGSRYRQVHAGWGDICWDCGDRWETGEEVDDEYE